MYLYTYICILIYIHIYAPCPLGTSGLSLRPCSSAICPPGKFFEGNTGVISGITRITSHDFFRTCFLFILHCFPDFPFSVFRSPRGAKQVPIEENFRPFWRYKWKSQNHGFVWAKPSFSWLEGVPRDLLCSTLRTMFFDVFLATTFSRFIGDLGTKRGPRGRPTPLSRLLFPPCLLGWPLGSPGSPKDPPGHENDTKMTPKWYQNRIKRHPTPKNKN